MEHCTILLKTATFELKYGYICNESGNFYSYHSYSLFFFLYLTDT